MWDKTFEFLRRPVAAEIGPHVIPTPAKGQAPRRVLVSWATRFVVQILLIWDASGSMGRVFNLNGLGPDDGGHHAAATHAKLKCRERR